MLWAQWVYQNGQPLPDSNFVVELKGGFCSMNRYKFLAQIDCNDFLIQRLRFLPLSLFYRSARPKCLSSLPLSSLRGQDVELTAFDEMNNVFPVLHNHILYVNIRGNLLYFLVTNKINFTYHMVILIVARLAFVEKKHHDVSIKMA